MINQLLAPVHTEARAAQWHTAAGTADALELLEKDGVHIFSCGTCLEYYGVKDRLRVGSVTNMYDTVDAMLSAWKVIGIWPAPYEWFDCGNAACYNRLPRQHIGGDCRHSV